MSAPNQYRRGFWAGFRCGNDYLWNWLCHRLTRTRAHSSNVPATAAGGVHFAMSRERAQSDVDQFNAYYEALSPKKREEYYGSKPASIATYERCFFCGQTDGDFRPYQDGDCPMGCTIQPVIWHCPTETENDN